MDGPEPPAAPPPLPMAGESANDRWQAIQPAAAIDELRAALAGRYAIERELGRGGMASVFLARDLRHDRAVAIKVLERDVGSAGAERFLREIRIAARLTHPHVLGMHDSGEAGGLLWYAMPYVEGETLRARLVREGALAHGEAVRLLRELADALAYAHAHGVVHRDLKPENVLLADGHAVIADFGIARALATATTGDAAAAPLTTIGIALGTPAYMAPEQVVGDVEVDHRADLYALGVIAYEVLTGTHPFGQRSPQALLAAHLTQAPAPLEQRDPTMAPALAALVMQLLAKEPAARPESATAVLRVLEQVAMPSSRPPRRRRLPAWSGAGALLVLAGMAAWILLRGVWPSDDGSRSGSGDGSAAQRTVAVLPFVNPAGGPPDEYFSEGLTDELSHALARIPGLRVAGRTSSYAFKGTAAPAQEIGRALGVGAFVTGTVRRAGERIRVSVQLVSATDGTVLRETISESGTGDVFAVQDALTREMVAALAPALGDRTTASPAATALRGTTDQEAYDLYLKGRYHWMQRGADGVRLAITYFSQAIARDPGFARAHAGLALAYTTLPAYVANVADSAHALATASARRALALDSTLADAQLVLASTLEYRGRLAEAEPRYRAARALEPWNPTTHHWYGGFLLARGDVEAALTELRQAVQLDPLAKSPGSSLAGALIDARRFAEAEAAARRVLAIDPVFPLALGALGMAQAFGGRADSAVSTLEHAERLYPDSPGHASLLFAYAAAGRWADADRLRNQIRGRNRDGSRNAQVAFSDLVFGDPQPLIALLGSDEGVWQWNSSMGGLGCSPLLDPLRSDARFVAAMRRIGVRRCPLASPWPIRPRPAS